MAESNRVLSRLMSFILLFDCQEAFHCCLVVACSNRINMISIQCHRVGEWSAGKPECGNCIVPVWGNHDYAGLNEVAIPFNTVQKDLDRICKWCDRNQLTINISKTKGMIFGNRDVIKKTTLPKFKIKNQELSYVTSYNYLGIKLDYQLNFESHTKESARQVAHKVYILSKIRPFLNIKQAIQIYKTKVLPYFDYGDILYIGTNGKSLDKLQKLQNRALRICLRSPPRTPVISLHKRAGLPMLADRHHAHLLNYMYKRSLKAEYHVVRPRNTRLFEGADSAT